MLNQFSVFLYSFLFPKGIWLVGRLLAVLMYRKIKMVVHPEKRIAAKQFDAPILLLGLFLSLAFYFNSISQKQQMEF